MIQNYKPSKQEVLTDIVGSNTASKILNFGSSLREVGKGLIQHTASMITMPYILPTAVRDYSDRKGTTEVNSLDEGLGAMLGTFIGGYIGIPAQILIYGHLANNDSAEFLAIPIATNLLSTIYEKARSNLTNEREKKLSISDSR